MTVFLAVVTIAGALYLTIAILCVLGFARKPLSHATEFLPIITILKPVAGAEADLYENLASFCDQDYEDFNVVFCLHEPDDPALPVVERVVRDFPACKARIAIGHNPSLPNPKIANLAKPGIDPRGEIIVIADSDIRVDRTYLRALAASFETESVGAVTCLYGGMPSAALASRLGALGIEDGFAPSVLVALALGKLRFCLGATMAVRAAVLAEIGGLETLGTHLADDHALGELVTARGHAVELSRYVVRTTVPETKLRELFSHELRWARTHLAMAPAGYVFSFVMYALPLALIYLALAHNLAAAVLVAVVLALRLSLHATARRAFSIAHRNDAWLLPLRDAFSLAVWAASFFSRAVRWRDLRVAIGSHGRMVGSSSQVEEIGDQSARNC